MKPDIKKYLNVYLYLQEHYEIRKAKNPEFSYVAWAKELNASDKSYVRLMVLGKRPINTKMTEGFAVNLGLTGEEREYFINLVQYTQSKTHEQRTLFGRKLMSLLRTEIEKVEIESHYDFLSNPLLPKLQVMLSFSDIPQAPEKLAWLLSSTVEEINAAIQKLTELKLIELKDNRYTPLKTSFKVPDSFGDLGLEAFYVQNLEAAKEAIKLPKEKRRFKSIFIPLNPDEFSEFNDSFQAFVNEHLHKYNTDNYADRALYQVHFNMIPAAEPLE